MKERILTIVKPQTSKLIDMIGDGYEAVNQRPWVVMIPFAFNIGLWFSRPVPLRDLLPFDLRFWERTFTDFGLRAHVLGWLLSIDMRSWSFTLGRFHVLLPSLPPYGATSPLALPFIVAIIALLQAVALIASGWYIALLSEQVRHQPSPIARTIRIWRIIKVTLLAIGTVGGIGLLLSLPFIALSALVLSAIPAATPWIGLSWYIIGFWILVYTSFIPEAAAMSHAGPLRTVYTGVNVARYHLGETLLILAVSLLISRGMDLVMLFIAANVWGVVLACLCSAYISSGLAAARLIFFRERVAPNRA